MIVLLDGTLESTLSSYDAPPSNGNDPSNGDKPEPLAPLDKGLLRFGLRRIEQDLTNGILDQQTTGVYQVHLAPDDLATLRRLMDEKTCSYQAPDANNLYCTAASINDETVVGTANLHRLAPTTKPVCFRCNLPDTDYICSHLVHPAIWGHKSMSHSAIPPRGIQEAACEQGRPL